MGATRALQPQELVITILGAQGRSSGEALWSGGMVSLLGDFGFSVGSARVALGRLARSELLERARDGRHMSYAVSRRLERVLAEGDRQIFGLGVADEFSGSWTVLWQMVPEELALRRRRLVGRLRFLGFGPIQNGSWVSPHDRTHELSGLLADLDLEDHVVVVVGRPATSGALELLVRQAWDLDALASDYEDFLAEIRPYRTKRSRARLGDREAFLLRIRLVHRFRVFPARDPGLPEHLLTPSSARREAAAAFHEVYHALAEPAQRYFDAAMRASGRRAAA